MAKEMMDLKKFKSILFEERKRLEEKEHRIDRRNSSASESGELGDLSDYDNHPADAATETENRTKDLAFDENINEMIGQIDEALRKIEDGTYGMCDRCGGQINPARLDAIPYATLCIDCQDIVEELG
ncbi:MAG: TraR/DksA C4-type zinc finger protein [Armatimonadota bacterium]|nr:TraR/DksA C4-type zinc finger protein [Armatimonadota bacterium]